MDTTSPLCQALLQARLRSQDEADYKLMCTFTRARYTRRGWLMLLSGLAGFNRNVTRG